MKKIFDFVRGGLSLVLVVLMVTWMLVPNAMATALSDNRDTPMKRGVNYNFLQGSNVIYAGALVCVNSSDVAVPASDATGLKVVGVCTKKNDNSGSTYAATDTINVRRGVFRFVNGDSITDGDAGSLAFVTDDQTVQKGASTYNIVAGVIVDVDSSGVWVDISDPGGIGATTPSSIACSGNATISGTLGVTGAATLSSTLNIAGAVTTSNTESQVGVETFTAKPVFNGGVDINEEVDVDMDAQDELVDITTSAGVTGGAFIVTINSTVADNTNQNHLLALTYTDDGDAEADFITCRDNSGADEKFAVGNDGNTTVGGTLAVTGASTLTGALTTYGATTLDNTSITGTVTIAEVTAASGVTLDLLATNAPSLLLTNAPTWVNVTYGGEVYVVPAFQVND